MLRQPRPLAAALCACALLAQGALAAEGALERARAIERNVQALYERTAPSYLVVSGGSGVVITPDGWALTNHHVVADRKIGDRFWVRRGDGVPHIAQLVGWDPRGDIALLKLDSEEPLPHLDLGDSDAVEVGDIVLALGNPYGFAWDARPTATLGIVSVAHTFQHNYSDAIQTDAPLNPGNSGGPLLNLAGEVIGINGRVAVRFGNRMNTGVGYAIASNQIRRFLPRLKRGGSVPHGRITGLFVRDVEPGGVGARVARVDDGKGAARAGLAKGDVIVAVDGRPTGSAKRLYGVVGTYPGGAEVMLTVRRGQETLELAALLEPFEPAATAAGSAFLGVELGGRTEDGVEGALVVGVQAEGPAAAAGIEAGDVIVAIGGTAVRSSADLVALIRARQPGEAVEIDILRGEAQLTLEAVLAARPGS